MDRTEVHSPRKLFATRARKAAKGPSSSGKLAQLEVNHLSCLPGLTPHVEHTGPVKSRGLIRAPRNQVENQASKTGTARPDCDQSPSRVVKKAAPSRSLRANRARIKRPGPSPTRTFDHGGRLGGGNLPPTPGMSTCAKPGLSDRTFQSREFALLFARWKHVFGIKGRKYCRKERQPVNRFPKKTDTVPGFPKKISQSFPHHLVRVSFFGGDRWKERKDSETSSCILIRCNPPSRVGQRPARTSSKPKRTSISPKRVEFSTFLNKAPIFFFFGSPRAGKQIRP